jgi:hypothetical protein
MPTGLADVLHDASVLHRFVDFIGEYCRQQKRSQTYVGSAAVFFQYVEQLAAGIQDELRREMERATRGTPRLSTLRRNMRTYRGYLRLLHALIKPAADAHSLTIPGPLVDLASQQLQKVDGMTGSRLLILLTTEFMYFQRPHTDVKGQARKVDSYPARPSRLSWGSSRSRTLRAPASLPTSRFIMRSAILSTRSCQIVILPTPALGPWRWSKTDV